MKRASVTIVVLACLVVVLSIVSAFTAVSSAKAALGTTGVPVSCSQYVPANTSTAVNLSCYAADGTAFGNNHVTVPAGHYLLVTDVVVSPYGPTSGDWIVGLLRMQGTTSFDSIGFDTLTRATFSEHFLTPFFVVSQDQSLGAVSGSSNSGAVSIIVTGLLTTNVTYVPLAAR